MNKIKYFYQVKHNGENALHDAANLGKKDICELLVENGINVNQRNDKGKTALDIAIEKGYDEISEYLQGYIQL